MQARLIFSPDFPTLGLLLWEGSHASYIVDGDIDLGECATRSDVRAAVLEAIDQGADLDDTARVSWKGDEYLLTLDELGVGLVSESQIAAMLGVSLPRTGKITKKTGFPRPAVRYGDSMRPLYDRQAVERWIEEHRK